MSHSPLFARRAQRAGALTAAAALALLAALGLVPGRSGATFAGGNGAIAFERYASGREDGRTAQIYIRGADGAVRRLTSLAGGAFDPAFSPDGATIAFDRRHERTHQPDELLAMNA